MFYQRNIKSYLLKAAQDTPVLLLNGARQTGKSTLLANLQLDLKDTFQLVNLDDLSVLNSIRQAPQAYLAGLTARHIIIDEVQHAPELFLPLKEAVDRNRQPGRFFLTGSANVLTLPRLADTLAGRMEIITMWPLSQGELHGQKEDFIELLFSDKPVPRGKLAEIPKLLETLVQGGYPEAVQRQNRNRNLAWFKAYITSVLQRELRELSDIRGLDVLPGLLTLIASRTGGLLNASDLSRTLSVPNATLNRYLSLLEAVYLTVRIPPWYKNIGKRLVKAPRLYLNDTGILCHLINFDADHLFANRQQLGAVLENFVVMELMKQSTWSNEPVRLYHYRAHTGQEVDLLLESGLKIAGIEIKTASTITQDDFKGLHHLANELGERFHRGVVIYTGNETVAFDKNLWAVPVSMLWQPPNLLGKTGRHKS